MWQTRVCRCAYTFFVCATHFEGGRWGVGAGLAARNLAGPITATSLPRYDAVHRRFRQAKLSGNDAYAVTLAMQLSNFVTIHDDPRPAKRFAFLLRSA